MVPKNSKSVICIFFEDPRKSKPFSAVRFSGLERINGEIAQMVRAHDS